MSLAKLTLAAFCILAGATLRLDAREMEYSVNVMSGEFFLSDLYDTTHAEIPEGVRKIAAGAFEFCETLEEVSFPDSLEEILGSAFWGCTGLTHVEIPDQVHYIASYAFNDCKSLEHVKLPESLKSIEAGTFRGCSSLKEIVLPDSVSEIKNFAFTNCTSLCRVFGYDETVFTANPDAFGCCPPCLEFIEILTSTNALAWVDVPLDPNGGVLDATSLRTICSHNYGLLPKPRRNGYEFDGWWTAKEGGSEVVSTSKVPQKSSVGTLYAHWRQLDAEAFTTGGDAPWTEISPGKWQSGQIAGGESTWLRKVVSGCGVVSFDWTLSYRHPTHYTIRFLIDGVESDSICFNTNWTAVSRTIDVSERHTLEWIFEKHPDAQYNDVCGWVSNIVWTSGADAEWPDLPADATADVVAETVASLGFADIKVSMLIGGDAAKYAAFREWANGLEGSASAVVASKYAADSFLLGATQLFVNEPRPEITAFGCSRDKSGLSLAIEFWDGDTRREVAAESVARLFLMTRDIRDWFGDGLLDFSVEEVTHGIGDEHSFIITPAAASERDIYLRLKIRPF